ncbi:MAG: LUD domain-containing protein [Candidatus Micrarchaeota archaeon]
MKKVNAITLDGKIVSTDGLGNRVAPVIFGPEKVILVIGANKIVKDVDQALQRIREIAAPINAKRHALKHHRPEFDNLPCARTGICVDCNHDWRICHYTVIIEGSMVREEGRINVVLVGEELGI